MSQRPVFHHARRCAGHCRLRRRWRGFQPGMAYPNGSGPFHNLPDAYADSHAPLARSDLGRGGRVRVERRRSQGHGNGGADAAAGDVLKRREQHQQAVRRGHRRRFRRSRRAPPERSRSPCRSGPTCSRSVRTARTRRCIARSRSRARDSLSAPCGSRRLVRTRSAGPPT